MTSLLVFILGAAVAQGLFLVTALAALPVRDVRARWLLTAVIAVLTITLTEEFLDVAGWPFGIGIGLAAEFATGPLILFFAIALVGEDPTPVRDRWAHFIPFGLSILWLITLNVLPGDRWVSLSNPEIRHWIALTVTVKCLYMLFYGWQAWRVLSRPYPGARSRAQAITWVRRWLYFFYAIYALAGASFYAFYFRLPFMFDSDYVGAVVLVASVYSLAYFALANRAVFDRIRPQGGTPADTTIIKQAQRILDETAGEGDMTLARLARGLGRPEAEVSEALNAAIPGGFYGLLNSHRLDVFRRLAAAPDALDRTVLDLALEAGFQSKATFYRVLKAQTGLTPAQFRARIDTRGPNHPVET